MKKWATNGVGASQNRKISTPNSSIWPGNKHTFPIHFSNQGSLQISSENGLGWKGPKGWLKLKRTTTRSYLIGNKMS